MKFQCSENSGLTERLEKAVASGRISHAYIFEAPSYFNKRDFTKAFAKGILCPNRTGDNCGLCNICLKVDHDSHEDILFVEKDGQSIKDIVIDELQEKLKIKPFGSRNIAIIEDCDVMTERAQNRLLKTIEEPPGDSVLILLSENMERLLPTIRSRCVKFRINVSEDLRTTDSKAEDKAREIVRLSAGGGKFYEMCKLLDKNGIGKGEGIGLLDMVQVLYRNMIVNKGTDISMLKDEDIYDFIHSAETAKRRIQSGIKADYAIKRFFIDICR